MNQKKKNIFFLFLSFDFEREKKLCGKPSQVGEECCSLLWCYPCCHVIGATDFSLVCVSMKLYGRISREWTVCARFSACSFAIADISIEISATMEFSLRLPLLAQLWMDSLMSCQCYGLVIEAHVVFSFLFFLEPCHCSSKVFLLKTTHLVRDVFLEEQFR